MWFFLEQEVSDVSHETYSAGVPLLPLCHKAQRLDHHLSQSPVCVMPLTPSHTWVLRRCGTGAGHQECFSYRVLLPQSVIWHISGHSSFVIRAHDCIHHKTQYARFPPQHVT